MSWNVDPIILQLGRLALSWYGLCFASGFLLGFQLVQWIYRREGRDTAELDRLLWFILIGTVVGMRLVHCFVYDPAYYLANPLEIPQVWRGGYASHGGVAGVLIAVFLYCRAPGRPKYLWLLDRLAIPGALAGAFIRIGNFFNSEIVGTPTSSPLGIVFKRYDKLPRHPVQLYEAAAYLFVFAVLLTLYRRKRKTGDGALTGMFFVLIFSARFVLEFFKTPQATYESDYAITVGQYLSLPFVLLGLFLLLRARSSATAVTPTGER